jgi:hypothetical protein
MSQTVGTQSLAPKNQLSVFNPAVFYRDEVGAKVTALAQENYIINSNTAQSTQISANDTTITNLFTPNPSIYTSVPATVTNENTNIPLSLAIVPSILNKKIMVNIAGNANWTTYAGRLYVSVFDNVTGTILHKFYVYPNYNTYPTYNVSFNRVFILNGTGNPINYNCQVLVSTPTSATYNLPYAPFSAVTPPLISIITL